MDVISFIQVAFIQTCRKGYYMQKRILHSEKDTICKKGYYMQKRILYSEKDNIQKRILYGGGFILACEEFGKMFDHLFPDCPFFQSGN